MAVAMQKFPPAESPTSTMCSPVVPDIRWQEERRGGNEREREGRGEKGGGGIRGEGLGSNVETRGVRRQRTDSPSLSRFCRIQA